MKKVATIIGMIVLTIANLSAQSTAQRAEMSKYDNLWAYGTIVKNEVASRQNVNMLDSSGNPIRIQSMISRVNGTTLKMEVVTTFDSKTGKQTRSQMKLSFGNEEENFNKFDTNVKFQEGLSIVSKGNLHLRITGNSQFEFPKLLDNGQIAIKIFYSAGANASSEHYYYVVMSGDKAETIALR